jgi:hypothetical protein
MGFTKEKTIIVSANDFLEKDAVCHAEFAHGGKHYLVQVVPDQDAPNPRKDLERTWTWATSRRAGYSDTGAMDITDWRDMEAKERERYLAWPLGLLRHSGDVIYIGSGAHGCDPGGWDSGQMGVAYMTKEEAVNIWGSVWKNGEVIRKGTRLTKKVREKAFECLKAEVAEMNAYLRGDVYGVVVTCLETEEDDSCWGFLCDGWKGIEEVVPELLPAGMAGAEKAAVIRSLEWAW